ncbi:hypothetical protein D8682_06800 [Buttiauxella sp. 3AFRM03]|uniref:hypothetical protein n=1 Tax=Buttiauxella sp. 3AFRM03 TaxID=2479367 RepID=UPI000EF7D70D|nr:hypothetical protein [Buttiauxella sp. 3AFRM03]AYN26719.1 hypothetical protein D8682_06800 [Buttiauxella sp. 3AFRM03]
MSAWVGLIPAAAPIAFQTVLHFNAALSLKPVLKKLRKTIQSLIYKSDSGLHAMTITYSLPIYWPLLICVASVSILAIGFYIKRSNKFAPRVHRILWGVACVGFLAIPPVATDKVTLDDEKLEQNTLIERKGFPLADLSSVTISNEKRRGRKGRKEIHEIWTASYSHQKSIFSPPIELEVGTIWKTNGADIVQRLRDRGIKVNDLR